MARPAQKEFICFLVVILTLAFYRVHGQEFRFRHLNTENGLSSDNVHVIFKDSRGFMWIGTDDGLNRYDGYGIRVFKNDPQDSSTIASNNIYAIKELNDGDLIIGTFIGLNRFNFKTEEFTFIDIGISEHGFDPLCTVRTIEIDSGINCWLGTDHGLTRLNLKTGKSVNYLPDTSNPADSSNKITAIFKEQENRFWVGTRDGLFHFDPVKEEFYPVPLFPDWYYVQPFDKIIHCFYKDSRGILWIGTHWFLFSYENGSFDWIGPPGYSVVETAPNSNAINAIDEQVIDGKQILWMATWGGLNRYDPDQKKCLFIFTEADNPQGLSSYAIATQFMDEEGFLWIGHEDRGVDILNLKRNNFEHPIIEGPGSNLAALSFLIDSKRNFWAGMDDHGLIQMDEDMNFVSSYRFRLPGGEELQNCDLDYIFEDSRGIIWIANTLLIEGLYIFDQGQRCFEPIDVQVPEYLKINVTGPVRYYSMIEDRKGIVWFGTSHGLYRNNAGNPKKITPVIFADHDSIRAVSIRCILEDRSANLWIGTDDHGLLCINKGDENLRYQDRLDLTGVKYFNFKGAVFSMIEDHEQNLWFGTSSGLYKMNRDDTLINRISDPSGLIPGNPVYGIFEDNRDMLWLNSQTGLIRFNPHHGSGLLTRKFDESDGLPFDNFSKQAFYQSKDGRIFIGGISATGDGFIFFNPGDISDNLHIPPIVITDFKVRNEEFASDSSILAEKFIRLNYNQNFFSFEFVALDYTSPEKNRYAYYLEGLEDDWIYAGNRRYVSYSSVPAGKYIFRVKGSNNNGYWNDEGISLAITILPPPWKTWWAYLIYGLVLIGLLFSWRIYDLKRQHIKHQLAVEHLEAEKLKELDHMKSRFFANISHEFRTPLTLVLGPIDKLLEIVPKEAQRDLRIMRRNARRLQHLIDQLLMLSKIESGQMKLKAKELNIIKLINGYVQSFESLARHKNIDLVFRAGEEELMVYVDMDKIEKILFNLLSNAFKFTPEGGKIEVSVSRQQSAGNHLQTADRRPQTADLCDQCITISVRDTGPGIPPGHLPRIFDRFYQADEVTTQLQEGTGIGLALVKELLELHHGSISVDSEAGKGTRFVMVLPTGKGHLHADEMADEESRGTAIEQDVETLITDQYKSRSLHELKLTEAAMAGKQPGDRIKPVILIVEDNSDLRDYIKGYLEGVYKTLDAIDGKEGLRISLENIPDLVISDVMMPEMDGFELCKRLKTDERTSHIPVILLTARAGQESKLEGLETGADDFITKPFDPKELQIRVKNLLEQRKKLKERFMQQAGSTGLSLLINLPGQELISVDEKFMQKAIGIVMENLGNSDFTVEDFASGMAMSHVQLHRKLVALTGQPANRFIRTVRLIKAAQLIRNKSGNITEIAFEVGFNNLSWFARCFHEQFGKSPSEYSSREGAM